MLVIYGLQFFLQKSTVQSRFVAGRGRVPLDDGIAQSCLCGLAIGGFGLWCEEYGRRWHLDRGGVNRAIAADPDPPRGRRQVRQRTPGRLRRIIACDPGKSILKPIVIAPTLRHGALHALCGILVPRLLVTSLTLIGMGAGGVALFLTGLILSSQPFKLNRNVATGTLLKNVVHPSLAAALVAALAVSPLIGREAIILSAVPSGFFGILFGLRFGVVSQDAGSTLIASTILSAATIPAAILLSAATH